MKQSRIFSFNLNNICQILSLVVAYFLFGKLGLYVAFAFPSATPVWPPTGLGIAVLLACGYRLWPGIFVGAFLVNFSTTGHLLSSLGIALGNTLESVLGFYLLAKFTDRHKIFHTVHGILKYVFFAGVCCTTVSALIGAVSLYLDGLVQAKNLGQVWRTWWLGDLTGALVFGPFFFLWIREWRKKVVRRSLWETVGLIFFLVLLLEAVFGELLYAAGEHYAVDFLCFPIVIWVAMRFGQRETSTLILVLVCTATYATLNRHGPFLAPTINDSLLLMQAFFSVLSICGMALAAAVAERDKIQAALSTTEEELRAAGRRKDNFLSMLAHELRNPLSSIASAVQLLQRAPGKVPPEEMHGIIDHQVKHLARLIDDLLDVARITRGKIRFQPETVELAGVIKRSVQAVDPLITRRRHQLALHVPSDPIHLHADPTRLEQILVNLLNNAAKYTDVGGSVTLKVSRQAKTIQIEVSDTGHGISDEMLPHIFEQFVQADDSMGKSQGGLGIGLALVSALTKLHDGSVSARSPGLGKGSTFTVVLPVLEQGPAEKTPTPKAQANSSQHRLKILLVDDNVDTLKMLTSMLESLGHEVTTAQDGNQALEAAAASEPQVVLLDIGLPGIDGNEVARRLRQDEKFKNILLIAISGFGQENDKKNSKAAGINYHLLKPVDFDYLVHLLNTHA